MIHVEKGKVTATGSTAFQCVDCGRMLEYIYSRLKERWGEEKAKEYMVDMLSLAIEESEV